MKRKKIIWTISVLLVTGIFAAACTPAMDEIEEGMVEVEPAGTEAETIDDETKAESDPMVFYDDMENKLEFMEYPTAIVSIAPSMTEMMFALGGSDQVVGRDDNSIFPEEAVAVTSVGSFWGDVPTEAILALEPDLILAAEIINPETVSALQDLGLQVYWQKNPASFEDLYENLRDIAALTGNQDTIESLISSLQARVTAVEEAVSGAESTPSVFYELDATDPANPWTTGSGTFIDYLITKAGGVNAAAEIEGDYVTFSAEQLIATNPDVILLGDALYGVSPESVGNRAGWDAIAAVKNGTVYGIDPNIVSVPGPRLVDGFEEMARLIHPDLFE